jgi:site-specific recombinase
MKQHLLKLFQIADFEGKVRFMKELVDLIRPQKPGDIPFAEMRLLELHNLLENAALQKAFSELVVSLLEEMDFADFFIDGGIPAENGFFAELARRFKHKLLAPIFPEKSLNDVLNRMFYKKSDYHWVNGIGDETWMQLFSRIQLGFDPVNDRLFHQIINAITVLSYRVAFYGTDERITKRNVWNGELQCCFLEQNKELIRFTGLLQQGIYEPEGLRRALGVLKTCEERLRIIRKDSLYLGTSLHQSFLLRTLKALIRRLSILADFMNDDRKIGKEELVVFFKQSVRYENTRTNITSFLSGTLSILAYQVAEHKGRIGEHYITTTTREYFRFFRASCGGGFIVSILVMLKILLHHTPMSPFMEALSISLNYAIGFVLIQTTGSVLATKQPAMTASAIAGSMDTRKEGVVSYFQLAVMVAKVCRSQTVSILGNLLLVFPFVILWTFLFGIITGHPLVDPTEAHKLLLDIHPFKSLSFFDAALTGFFIFLSGVFAGFVDNKMLYARVGDRMRRRLTFGHHFKAEELHAAIDYMEAHAGSLAANLLLGFLFGMALLVGHLLSLPIDIRHITFSAGNMAIALFTLNFSVPREELLWCVAGVLGIGTLNFVSSFAFAFFVAIKSRNINLKQYSRFSIVLFRYLGKRPWHFIIPPKKEPREQDILSDETVKEEAEETKQEEEKEEEMV